jgi:TonB-linked SusC/RagA family outer membrane protein
MKIMRLYYFYRKYRYAGLLLLFVLLSGTICAQDKPAKTSKIISFSLKVVDDNGTPIPNAKVVIGEGIIYKATDENGACASQGYPNDYISISASGYDKVVVLVQEVLTNSTIKLKKAKLFMTSEDNIPLPFIDQKKRLVTGSASNISSNQLEKYPSTDIRNAFTGLVPGLQITEYDGSPGFNAEEKLGFYNITEKIGVSARGRNMIYIIDDIPTDVTELPLDPQEIESVTVVKDIVGKAMYGPIGADGIILIKTKRGIKNERVLTVNIEDGVDVIDRMPEWTKGADYAALNNQARSADGLASLYSSTDIAAYAINDPYDKYHPSVDFRGEMLKNTRAFRRANVSSSGGNEVVQYSAYIGYNGEGDIYKAGPTADYNRINTSSNVDIKINNDINVLFDIAADITFRRSANFGYATSESSSLTDIIELNSALPFINNTPPTAFPIYANNDPSLKYPWFGVSSLYPINPIGNLINNGYYTETGRKATAKFGFDYDLSKLIKGLKSETFLGFDVLDLVRMGTAEDYIAYIVTPSKTSSGNDTLLYAKAHDGVVSATLTNLHDYFYERTSFYENLYFQRSSGNHNVQSTLTYLWYKVSRNGIEEPNRQQNGIWTTNYTYKDKYTIQGVLNYAGTYTFEEGERYKLFPSVGASWILSEEGFMSSLKFVDFLKLRAEAGILGYENFMSPFLYRDRWIATTGVAFGPYSQNRWFGTTSQTVVNSTYPSRIGHPGLTWETRKEFSMGIDGLLFNKKLSLEVNYYNNLRDGVITNLSNTMPYVAGISSALPSVNYNKIRYFGVETGIQFTNNAGKFQYSIGGNATLPNTKYEKFNEPDYRFDYQRRTGEPIDGFRGFTYLGKFQSDAEALIVPQLFDAVLKQGDLKYKDMNNDGFIDDNDISTVGHTTPRLFYTLNVNFRYKNFELFVIGNGTANYDIPMTNTYFWNGWGDNNYSNFVRDNVGGAYPRLTYYKVNNNFVNSDFWLAKGGYFKIQNVELAYNITPDKLQAIRSRGIRVFIKGANLLTLSEMKDVDPESINSGVSVYPLYKTFTGGIKLTF